ncbi:lantibiotic dehydratase [Oerskovia sp. KBS0722]|uniref:lantibiotic dehydratase n=1 Tax=Oerskovia sp. KBS0722 TaxID=1179673 RepID=UPI00110D6A29|nr:lantibiotic dehydratase [Oerskovia sp. KBS0722]QDW63977.1 hypothetical protein FFI11_016975 [Oerskovia sp. KBS0722]
MKNSSTTSRTGARTTYSAAGFFLLRAPLLPARWLKDVVDAPATSRARGLLTLLDQPGVRTALTVSAPDLMAEIERSGLVDEGTRRDERRLGAVQRYLVRMSTRATPFGLLATVSGAQFGDSPMVLGPTHDIQVWTREDMGLTYAKAREGHERVARDQRWWWNELAVESGGRLYLSDTDVYGEGGCSGVRVRSGEPVRVVRALAREGATRSQIEDALRADAGRSTAPDRISRFLDQLLAHRILLTDDLPVVLRPRSVAAEHGPTPLSGFDPEATRASLRLTADGYQGEVMEVHAVRPTSGHGLPAEVGERLADATSFLVSICRGAGDAVSDRDEALDAYHHAFVERFGVGAAVPIATVLDPVTGIGTPTHYGASRPAIPNGRAVNALSDYERLLADVLARALATGSRHVEITPALETEMLACGPGPRPDAPHQPAIDVFAQIGRSVTDRRPEIVLNATPLGYGGASFGRFEHVLDDATRGHLHELHRRRENASDAIVAEVIYPPRPARYANVAVRPQHFRYHISINAPAVSGSTPLPLSDIHVVASPQRLELWSAAHRRSVVTVANHLLSPDTAPVVVRLMAELSERQFQPIGGFSWGPFEGSLRLPRVVRDGVVLRVAEWSLTVAELGSVVTPESITSWRERWDVPAMVYLVDADRRLALDLRSDVGFTELRRALRAGSARLHEMLPVPDDAWLVDTEGSSYFSEVVVPVVIEDGTTTSEDLRRERARTRQYVIHDSQHEQNHSSAWVYVKVHTPPELQDTVLGKEMPRLLHDTQDVVNQWFFVRYADPRPHLRLRFRPQDSVPGATEEVVRRVQAWCDGLVRAGLAGDWSSHRYLAETGRYGGAASLELAEALFDASSRQVVDELATTGPSPNRDAAITNAVRDLDAMVRAWGLDREDRQALATRICPPDDVTADARTTYRALRSEILDALSADAPDAIGLDAVLRSTVRVREGATSLGSAARQSLLLDLIHMHLNRKLPSDATAERDTYAVWRLGIGALAGRQERVAP